MELSIEDQRIADLAQQRDEALADWRRLSQERMAYFKSTPNTSPAGVDFLRSGNEAERRYRDLQAQWVEASRRRSEGQ
jgi:hypothetical protein